MGTTISVGHEVTANLDGNTICFDKITLGNTKEVVWEPSGAICGDIDPPNNRVQKGRLFVRGSIEISVTGAILDAIIPKLGVNNTSGTIYELGATDTLPTWACDVAFGGALHNMTDCRWTKWSFVGTRGSRPIKFRGEFIGADETEGSLPITPSALDVEDIYGFTDITTYTIDATSRANADRFLLSVDNNVVPEWGWSTTLTAASIGARQMLFATSTPYVPTHDDMYWSVRDDETGMAIVLTITSADRVCQFSSPTGIGIGALGPVNGKGEQIRATPTFIGTRSDNLGTRVSPLTITLSAP